MSATRSYAEMVKLATWEERFEYLKLGGRVGQATFGFDRYLGQGFYTSQEWKRARSEVIVRDMGCDLAVPGYEIPWRLLVHHINPLTPDDIRSGDEVMIDPDNLVCVSHKTHNELHYGNYQLRRPPVERAPGDTKLW